MIIYSIAKCFEDLWMKALGESTTWRWNIRHFTCAWSLKRDDLIFFTLLNSSNAFTSITVS